MRIHHLVIGLALGMSPALASAQLLIDDNGIEGQLDCGGQVLLINGNHNTLEVTGYCAQVIINGNRNHITVAQTSYAEVRGNRNTVMWIHGGVPEISDQGNDNLFAQYGGHPQPPQQVVIYEQAPPPVIVQQAPRTVVVQPAPRMVRRPGVVVQAAPRVAVQRPAVVVQPAQPVVRTAQPRAGVVVQPARPAPRIVVQPARPRR